MAALKNNSPSSLDDSTLVTRAKTGDMAAFEELVSRHESRVYTTALRMLRHEQDAQDITQEAFTSAIAHLESFRGDSSFSTWILRIAAHAALKVIRKRKGLELISLESATEQNEDGAIPHPEYIADWRQSPEELVARNETREMLEVGLAKLDEKHRLVFVLRDVEGFSIKETAESLGITEANVKVRLLRARLLLREHFTRLLGDPRTRLEPHRHDD